MWTLAIQCGEFNAAHRPYGASDKFDDGLVALTDGVSILLTAKESHFSGAVYTGIPKCAIASCLTRAHIGWSKLDKIIVLADEDRLNDHVSRLVLDDATTPLGNARTWIALKVKKAFGIDLDIESRLHILNIEMARMTATWLASPYEKAVVVDMDSPTNGAMAQTALFCLGSPPKVVLPQDDIHFPMVVRGDEYQNPAVLQHVKNAINDQRLLVLNTLGPLAGVVRAVVPPNEAGRLMIQSIESPASEGECTALITEEISRWSGRIELLRHNPIKNGAMNEAADKKLVEVLQLPTAACMRTLACDVGEICVRLYFGKIDACRIDNIGKLIKNPSFRDEFVWDHIRIAPRKGRTLTKANIEKSEAHYTIASKDGFIFPQQEKDITAGLYHLLTAFMEDNAPRSLEISTHAEELWDAWEAQMIDFSPFFVDSSLLRT
jgi:uncharacterized protein YozE (UPF0346 family)